MALPFILTTLAAIAGVDSSNAGKTGTGSLASGSGKKIVVDLSHQKLYAIEGNRTVLSSPISSGRWGYETPSGRFRVLLKDKDHVSSSYPKREWEEDGGAKMPYTIKITNTGIAIHAGELPGRPDSHGCIRVPYGKAMQLFRWTKVGIPVVVKGKTPYTDRVNRMRKEMGLSEKPKVGEEWFMDNPINEKYDRLTDVDDSLSYLDSL